MTRLFELQTDRHRWPSGFTSLITNIAGRQQVYLTVSLRTGSRFESEADNGVSHFVEHMLFRGTRRHPSSHELASAFEDLGGTLCAATAADHGSLSIALPAENLLTVIPYVAEVFAAPLLEGIEVERAIIREELLEDLGDDHQLIDGPTLLRNLAFGSDGLGQPIAGPLKNVERFDESTLRLHHARTYVGNHTIASVAGPVDPELTFRALEDAFAPLRQGPELTSHTPHEQRSPRFDYTHYGGSSQSAIHVGFRGPGHRHPLEPALEMLLRVLDDGMSTRLYHRLCDSQGLCYDTSATYEAYADVGLVELEADTAHERAEEVVNEMLALVAELADRGVTEKELESARRRARWHYEALSDDVAEVADSVAVSQMQTGEVETGVRLGQLLDVSLDDVKRVAEMVFSPQGRNVVIVGNAGGSGKKRLQELCLQT